MKKLGSFLFFIALVVTTNCYAQKLQHDWENYVVALKDKPVSINVDLGLRSSAPLKDMPFVIIVRTKLNQPNAAGMPDTEELISLDALEEKMVEGLVKYQGALYVGRFTQRGIREFYFYTNDTARYLLTLNDVFLSHPDRQWLAQSKKDAEWENYLTVLYPSPLDKMLIDSRRKLGELGKDDPSRKAVTVFHFFEFNEDASRKKFLQLPVCSGFTVNELGTNQENKRFTLLISSQSVVDRNWVDKNIPVLFSEAKKQGGFYKGWEYQR
jgi:hypothetical protein